MPADLIVADLDAPWIVREADMLSRSKNSCFEGARLQGKVLQTMVAGRTVHRNDGGSLMSDQIDWAGNLPTLCGGHHLGLSPRLHPLRPDHHSHAPGSATCGSIGSGNIGATNVLRTGNKKLAALTLLLDALKGTVAVLVAAAWGPAFGIVAGFAAFLGHLFPVWLGFRGGKGVATYLGVLIALAWKAALVFAIVWIAIAYLTRYSSLAALLAAVAVPLSLFFWFGPASVAWLFTIMSVIVFFKHHANIRRLLDGNETRIGASG
jgi:glycerol-3-phosphate acyltransferase PlsY